MRKREKTIAIYESDDQEVQVEVLKLYENLEQDETTSYILRLHRNMERSYGLEVSAKKEAMKYVTSYEKSIANMEKLKGSFT